MTSLLIFGAKYLVVLPPLLALEAYRRATADVRRLLVLRGILMLTIGVILAKGAGMLYNEPRPFVTGHFTPLIPHEPDNGFPSDHTLLAFSCALLILPIRRRLALAAVLIAFLVGMARIACGLHTPLDIGASIVFAVLSASIAVAAIRMPADEPAPA